MAPTVRQASFSSGELEPLLWGRTDLPLHAHGLRRFRNFFPAKSGAAVSRPGTTYVASTKFDSKARLIPFVAGDGESAVLEFTEGRIRVYTLGKPVVLGGGIVLQVATEYTADSLEKLRFAQVGDVLTIVHPYHPPQELRRLGPASWRLDPVSFSVPVLGICRDVGAATASSQWFLETPFPVVDTDHVAQEWLWQVTARVRSGTTGIEYESVPADVNGKYNGIDFDTTHQLIGANRTFALYSDRAITISRSDTALAQIDPANAIPAGDTILGYNIYRGRGGLFGFVGSTTSRKFVDVGGEPDYAKQPPQGVNPFLIGNDTENPGAVAFFQQRRCFAASGWATPVEGASAGADPLVRTPNQSRLYLSAIDDYTNFDPHKLVDAPGEALLFELAAMTRQANRHLVGLSKLVVLTDSSAWVGAGNSGPLDFDNVDFMLTDQVGASDVVPLVVDGVVLFVRTKGLGARALVPADSFTPYTGTDISEQSRHLFLGAGKSIIDWAYAEDPWGVVWAVRADGALLSLTFSRGRQMAAWARHDMDGGIVESVCSVPEGEEDAVYLVVRRTIGGVTKRYVERMTSRVRRVLEGDADPVYLENPTPTDTDSLYPTDVCLDCAVPYVGVPTTNPTPANIAALEGLSVWVVARGQSVAGPFTVRGGQFTDARGDLVDVWPDEPNANAVDGTGTPIFVAWVGVLFTPELETLDAAGDRLRKKTIARVGFEVDESRGLSVGQDFEHLKPWRQRQVSDGYDPISAATALVDTPVASKWDQSARAVLRQTLPLPVTVVGITRELAIDEG